MYQLKNIKLILYTVQRQLYAGFLEPGLPLKKKRKEKRKFRFSTENDFESHTLHM